MISGETENEYVKFLSFRQIQNSKKQEIEYYFLIKKRPEKEYVFFEHFLNKFNTFYPFAGISLNPHMWKSGEIWSYRSVHYLPPGNYELRIGFATTLPEGLLTEERMQFKECVDNTISLGTVNLQQIQEEELLNNIAVINSHNIISEIQSINLPVCISSNGMPVFSLNHGDNENKIMIISLPKAGTYLISEIVKNLGFEPTGIHISLDHVEDYRRASLKDADAVRRFISIDTVVKLVTSGQFTVGHIPHCIQAKITLKDFKKIFVYRNLRDLLASALRSSFVTGWNDDEILQIKNLDSRQKQLERFLEIKGSELTGYIKSISEWINEKDVLKISFEEIQGDFGSERQLKVINSMSDFLGSPYLSLETIESILRSETLTSSGMRTNVEDYWNETIESMFLQLGLDETNKKLGY